MKQKQGRGETQMKQFIAPRGLKVNSQPAPCNCSEKIICEYCTQANLILYERKKDMEEGSQEKIIGDIRAKGIRKTARLLKIQPSTVTRWIKSKKIPQEYIEKIKSVA